MLIVRGIDDTGDVRLIKQFATYTLARFLTPSQIKRLVIDIHFKDRKDLPDPTDKMDLTKYEAWMVPDMSSRRHFYITMANKAIRRNGKCRLTKYKKVLQYLAHELVHVKQYYLNEMKDVFDAKGEHIATKWMGVAYPAVSLNSAKCADPIKAEWAYYNSPWEVEAYGRTEGIYNMFHDEKGEPWRKNLSKS
jgi:hypothetical protein